MLEIIVTGSEGQLGKEFQQLRSHSPEYNFTFVSRKELDISNEDELELYLAKNKSDVLINCAAYTNVERAEDCSEEAALINETASGFLAKACQEHDVLLIHISTDYVFDGKGDVPYTENMNTHPLNVYGRTKLGGEHLIQQLAGDYLIIRTSWLYSTFGKNFLKTIKKAAGEKEELKIVNDQISAPTCAQHLVVAILKMMSVYDKDRQNFPSGIYHFSNSGTASWYDFAVEIVEQLNLKCNIVAVNSDEFVTKARRPSFSKLNCDKISNKFELELPHWKEGLKDCIKNWINE